MVGMVGDILIVEMEVNCSVWFGCVVVVDAGSAEILCAEVVFNPMQLYINVGEVDDCLMSDAIHFLYTIRYINSPRLLC